MASRSDAARVNGKKGGRPRGRKNNATLKREAVLKAMQQRIMQATDLLLDAQFSKARGQQFLYKIEKYYEKVSDKEGKVRQILRAKPPKLVESQYEIRKYIESEVLSFNGEMRNNEPDADYYFMTTKEPDTHAIDSLFSRTFGRSVQPVTVTDDDGKSIFDHDSKEKAQKALGAFFGASAAAAPRAPRARRKKRN